jgi:uncharacterized membrane protein
MTAGSANSRQENKRKLLIKFFNYIGLVGIFAAFAWGATTFVQIPVPVSGGYFNIGDTFVMASAILFGPVVGASVGLIGPPIADLFGYPQFAPATAAIKFTEGLVVGLIGFRKAGVTARRCILSLCLGGVIIVIGYFVFEAYLYPALAKWSPFFDATNMGTAVAEILPNVLQALLSGLLAYGIWALLRGPAPKLT